MVGDNDVSARQRWCALGPNDVAHRYFPSLHLQVIRNPSGTYPDLGLLNAWISLERTYSYLFSGIY